MRSTTSRRRSRRAASRSTRFRPEGALPDARQIAELFDMLDPIDDGALLRLSDPDDGSGELELGWRPLRGEHPVTELLGFEAPPDWAALGTRVGGNAWQTDDPAAERQRVMSTFVVCRDGSAASRLRWTDGSVDEPGGPFEGLVPDACRRALGLATPPPPEGTERLWTALWVDAVMSAWTDPNRRRSLRSWAGIDALHPVRGFTPHGDLVTAARLHATAWPWARLCTAPTFLGLPGRAPTPELLRWFDAGSLARWMTAQLPPIDEIVESVSPLLEGDLGERLETTVAQLLEPG